MTRKTALNQAISILSKRKGTEEIVEKLIELSEELPLVHWSDKSIRDTVEQFKLDYGRNPTVTDFKKKGLPSHPVIKLEYGITLAEWLEQNYPTEKLSPEEIKSQYTEIFIKQYNIIKPKSADIFNKNRSKECHSWRMIARLNDCKTWRGLINKLDLEHFFDMAKDHKPQEFNVKVYTDIDEQLSIYSQDMIEQGMETPFLPELYPNVHLDDKKNKKVLIDQDFGEQKLG